MAADKTLAKETGHKKRKIGMQTRQHKMENSSQQASCSTAELNSYSSVATDSNSAEYLTPMFKMCRGV